MQVCPKPSSAAGCVDELEKLLKGEFSGQSGIIYTLSIKDTEELAKELRGRDIRVAPYHAMLETGTRSKIHRKWVENIYQVRLLSMYILTISWNILTWISAHTSIQRIVGSISHHY